jgi:hypothetical protein
VSDPFWFFTGGALFVVFVIYVVVSQPAPTTCAEAVKRCAGSRGWDCDEVDNLCQEKAK